MFITILLKNGQKHEFQNAEIQKKNNGRSTAVYDINTFRIIAEYNMDQILMCRHSRKADSTPGKRYGTANVNVIE